MTKIALITGATSGIGSATVRRLVAGGWLVVGTGRRKERLDGLARNFPAGTFHGAAFDICDRDATAAAIEALPPEFAAIDLLVNNAGLALGTVPAQHADRGDWRTMVETNIMALVDVTHRLLPRLIERRGAIINLSSTAATYPYTGGNVYAGTKAFVHQFSLGLRSDLHGTGVRVTSIEPGMVETEFTLIRTGGDKAASDNLYAGSHPLTGDDIADMIYWTASLPPHVNINTLETMPVSQSFAGFQVARGE
ncbi:SDR family NAD(P)-dependent oxidoreductase [Novosphingobium resinovorum]|uniref:SDR family NAD(P)-dependent oxidoreductase n=1 Tax=Novosphingobium resinovorum TaxID=158500 RepID=UPI002ED674E7|nr:SDR family NAD(P)-dependent oxidoreductase [Novosphingobium resinovorum]